MNHRIETNVIFQSAADIEKVRKTLLHKIEEKELGSNVFMTFLPVGSPIAVEINGNGALLRDVAFSLDVAGMLD